MKLSPKHDRVDARAPGAWIGVLFFAILSSARTAHADDGPPPLVESVDADSPPDAPDGPPIEVVVTGSRMHEPRAGAVVATEVIARPEIEESGARNLAELLEERSGLQVHRSFRGAELWLRGLDPQYALILVDGDRVPGRIGNAIDLSRYGVENIERIEIVRGPSSALYGSEAIGGVVNILTRESERPLEADLMASYGQGQLLDVTGMVAGQPTKRLRLMATGGFHHADAFRLEAGAATSGSARSQPSASARIDVLPNERNRLRLQANAMRLTLTGVDEAAGGAILDRTQLQEQAQASLEHRGEYGRVDLVHRVTYSQFREQTLLDQRGGTALDAVQDYREHVGQITSIARWRMQEDHVATVGFEAILEHLRSTRLSSIGDRHRFAPFAQHEWTVWEQGATGLKVVPGVRLDLDSQFGGQFSPKLATRLDVDETFLLRASYGRGFRAPSFQQLLLRFENSSVGYVVAGNPELGPERSHGFDAGVEWSPTTDLGVTAYFFRNDLSEMIAVVTVDEPTVPGTFFTYANLRRAWTMGAESSLRYRVTRVLQLTAGYTFTETWDGENERRLEGRARHRATIGSRLAWPAADIGLVSRAAVLLGRTYYVDPDGDGVDEPTIADPLVQIDLRLFKRFSHHLEFFAGVDNLVDAGDRFALLRPRTIYGGLYGRY